MRCLLILGLACTLAGCVAVKPPATPTSAAPSSAAPVESGGALDERIDVAHLDRKLLARAIFDETNRVRARHGLPAFQHLPKLDDAADLESAVGRVYQPPSHTNPFPPIGTPMARVKYVGLKPAQVAENIALIPIYEDAAVAIVLREGKPVLVHPGTYEPAQRATYRGFAVTVLKLWMDSPGHRANIVNPALKNLGCSVEPTVSMNGIDQMFCVQVFFTPGVSGKAGNGVRHDGSTPFDRSLAALKFPLKRGGACRAEALANSGAAPGCVQRVTE